VRAAFFYTERLSRKDIWANGMKLVFDLSRKCCYVLNMSNTQNPFKVGDVVTFNHEKWAKEKFVTASRYSVRISALYGGTFSGEVVSASGNRSFAKGSMGSGFITHYFSPSVRVVPFRDNRGRFAKPQEFTVFLREIRVVPVRVTAANVEHAEVLVREGDGDYQNDKATHSDLSADEYFNLFEKPTIKN
jgi:hypothetical protein